LPSEGPAAPDLAELDATVARMEARYRNAPLYEAYLRLCRRFEADLHDPRDLALSKAAALMLVKCSSGDAP
jgi:hypothetical protein